MNENNNKKKGIKTVDTHAHVKCWSRTSGKYRRAVNLSCPSLDHLPLHRPLLLRHAAPRRLCVQINPSPFFCISTPCYCWCVAHFKVRFRKKKKFHLKTVKRFRFETKPALKWMKILRKYKSKNGELQTEITVIFRRCCGTSIYR